MATATTNKPTRVAVGSVRPGMVVRLANRSKTDIGADWVTVTDKKGEDVEPGKAGYRVFTADGEYGHFAASARFELQPPEVAKAETTAKQAASGTGSRVSDSLKRAIKKLFTPEGERGELTRRDLHADPMVVIAAERRGWVTVDRSGPERGVDLITLTEEGEKAGRRLFPNLPVPAPKDDTEQEIGDDGPPCEDDDK